MKISLNWLKEYININNHPSEIAEILTDLGLEVSHTSEYELLNKELVIGEVLTCDKHPNADKLKITTVNVGTTAPLKIVCGAPNVRKSLKVIVAPIGTTLTFYDGSNIRLKKTKIRGEISEGMICAEDEIGLGSNHSEIIELNTPLRPGTSITEHYKTQKDVIFSIDLTPNRSDAFSHIGVARDLGARLGIKIDYPKFKSNIKVESKKSNQDIKIEIENTELCPRYSGVILKNVKIEPSQIWLKEKLLSIGLKPINNIVDITNFVLHETGQPLHAFDYDLIQEKTIIVKNLKKSQKFLTLDNKERILSGEELMICDSNKPMCVAGIMGGKNSHITSKTTNVFLESAYFLPSSIAKSSKRLGIHTDASYRYERGTDPNSTVNALLRAISFIVPTTKAEISSEVLDIYPKKIDRNEIKVSYKNISKLIGENISRDTINNILKSLEIEIKEYDKDTLHLSIPTYRVDITREADIIEEILRIYGYNNVGFNILETNTGSIQSESFVKPNEDKSNESSTIVPSYALERKELVGNFLVFNGYNEIITNSLTAFQYYNIAPDAIDILKEMPKFSISAKNGKENKLKQFHIQHNEYEFQNENEESDHVKQEKKGFNQEIIEIVNPLSNITNILRPHMLYSGLEVISNNINKGNQNLKLFEFGKIYHKQIRKMDLEKNIKSNKAYLNYYEGKRLSIYATKGGKIKNTWISKTNESLFDIVNAAVQCILLKLGIQNIAKKILDNGLIFDVNGQSIAVVSKIDLSILKKFKINQEVIFADMDWDYLMNCKPSKLEYKPISSFPAVSRDLSLIIDKSIIFDQILNETHNNNDKRIRQINLTDIYYGKEQPDKKTYTLNFKIQDDKKTLKDKDIDKLMNKLMKAFEENLNAVIRRN